MGCPPAGEAYGNCIEDACIIEGAVLVEAVEAVASAVEASETAEGVATAAEGATETAGEAEAGAPRAASGPRAAGEPTQLQKNAAQRAKAEKQVAEKLGDKVAGKQVTFKTSDGTTTRTDIVTKENGGNASVEVKSGNGQLSKGQQKLFNDAKVVK